MRLAIQCRGRSPTSWLKNGRRCHCHSAAVTQDAEEDGREAYVFDGYSKHQRTVDTRTGATTVQMTYDAAGLLIAVADVDGDVTTVERDALGVPLSITGPFGQVTRLQVNAEGYLSDITNPAEETVSLGYGDEGLLTSFTDALE
jgi:YD repeat-containing protein